MSLIGVYSKEQFKIDWPIDFGSGVRGIEVHDHSNTVCGLAIVHRCSNGEVCGGSVLWRWITGSKPPKDRPLWALVSEAGAPITLTPSIQCKMCNEPIHGYITNGVWVAA